LRQPAYHEADPVFKGGKNHTRNVVKQYTSRPDRRSNPIISQSVLPGPMMGPPMSTMNRLQRSLSAVNRAASVQVRYLRAGQIRREHGR
jgi:hypothetical protein